MEDAKVAITETQVDREPSLHSPEPPVPLQSSASLGHAETKMNPWRLIGPFLAAVLGSLITATALICVNINVARYHKHLDRMYQILSETGRITGLLEDYTWNVWYARKWKMTASTPITDLQQAEASAKGLELQLPLVFANGVGNRMEEILHNYWNITYPITHAEEFPTLDTMEEMNKKLNPIIASSQELTEIMREAISKKESASWWNILWGKER